jgi:hypothetical protein
MLTRASALSLATPKCSFEPETEMISTSHQGVKSPKKGRKKRRMLPKGNTSVWTPQSRRLIIRRSGEEGLIRQPAERGNSKWRRDLALYPRMDIAG